MDFPKDRASVETSFAPGRFFSVARRGESEQRIYLLSAWREAPCYTPRERAALAWTESVTLVSETHVPDDVYEEARRHFNERELTELTVAIMIINSWNRLLVAMRRPVDVDYRGR